MSDRSRQQALKRLERRLPATIRWYSGKTAPKVGPHEIVYWEDTTDNVAKILMKRSNTLYRFLSVAGTGGPEANIVDADGTLADVTSKFNTLLASLESLGLIRSA